MTILAATSNAHKLCELRSILGQAGITVLGAKDVGGIPEVTEDGDSFEANAAKKAIEVAQATGRTVFADDSGIAVDALDGAPGIYSARYAGDGASDADNLALLLARMAGETNRAARFVCVIALASPEGLIGTARGELPGRLLHSPRGESGFGYDPIFVPVGDSRSLSEMGAAEKDAISHRANALKAALADGLFADAIGEKACNAGHNS
jgi:XTP/dITP diphosphohydrolase